MKKSLVSIALLCFVVFSAVAQDGDATSASQSFTQAQDSLLLPLDKGRIPHGILYDRVYPFAGLDFLTDGDTVDPMRWLQGFSELQRASYGFAPSDSFVNYNNARDFVWSENYQHRLPLLLLHARYARIDTPAYGDGRLVFAGGRWHDGSNPASPYVERSVCLGVLGTFDALEADSTYSLYLTPGYDFGTADAVVRGATLTDVTQEATWNVGVGETRVQFVGEGNHWIKLTLDLTDGQSITYWQVISVVAKTTGPCEVPMGRFFASVPFKGFYENTASAGVGEWQIYFGDGNCDGKLRKPIVVLDGFDPGDGRKARDIYMHKLAYLKNGAPINDSTRLGDELRAKGYDIVVLNFPKYEVFSHTITTTKLQFKSSWPFYEYVTSTHLVYVPRDGGADYIERNAFVMAELLAKVNTMVAQSGSKEKTILVGPSMGGQISRYGLKWMEQNGWNHNVKLWVSFDSPHWGANIPYGFQKLLQYLHQKMDNEGAKASYEGQLRSPAAQQMLIHQTNPDDFDATSGSLYATYQALNNNSPLRSDWRTKLVVMGYPSNLRKIALVNGRYTGGQFQSPGGKMFHMKAKDQLGGFDVLMAEPYFLNKQYSTPQNVVKVWKLGSGNVVDQSDFTSLAFGPLDGCPGGLYDVQRAFYNESVGQTVKVPIPWYAYVAAGGLLGLPGLVSAIIARKAEVFVDERTNNISFIPTVSGLGINQSYFPWTDALNINDLLCNHKTPFDNIYAPAQNQDHVSLSPDNVAWLMSELDQPQITATSLLNTSIPDPLKPVACGYNIYTIPGLAPGATVTWSVSGALQITSTNGNDAWIRPNHAGATGTITALVTPDPSKCVSYTATLTTTGTVDRLYSLGFDGMANCNWQAAVKPVISGDGYAWSDGTLTNSPNGPVKIYGAGGPTYYPSYFPTGYVAPPATPLHVYAIVTTGCVSAGVVSLSALFDKVADACSPQNTPGGGSNYRQASTREDGGLNVLPNPTTSDWLLVMNGTAAEKIEAVLTDAVGRAIWSHTKLDDFTSFPPIPGASLSSGMYFLTVRVDGRSRQFKLMKQ